MKYIIPRNKLVPDLSFEDVLRSGSILKDRDGRPLTQHIFVYRGTDPRLPTSALVPVGRMFFFVLGLIYVPDKALSLLDYVAEPFKAAQTLTSGGLTDLVFGNIPEPLKTLLEKAVEHALSPEKELKAITAGVSELTKMDALYLPGVQIVEIDHLMIPRGFLRAERHHVLLTYERQDGGRATYTLAFFGAQAETMFDSMSSVVLTARWRAEFAHLVQMVKEEQIDTGPLWTAATEKYQARYGGDWNKHIDELVAEVNKVFYDALDRKGFTQARGLAEVLKRIGPLVPHYRQVPELRDWVRALEEGRWFS